MQIKVKLYAPAFISHAPVGADGCVELEEGATLGSLYTRLKLPLYLRLGFFWSVNSERGAWNTPLKDGDEVSFLFPLSGG
jgi:molybdopterin converting factor small subunit